MPKAISVIQPSITRSASFHKRLTTFTPSRAAMENSKAKQRDYIITKRKGKENVIQFVKWPPKELNEDLPGKLSRTLAEQFIFLSKFSSGTDLGKRAFVDVAVTTDQDPLQTLVPGVGPGTQPPVPASSRFQRSMGVSVVRLKRAVITIVTSPRNR
jgi:hypothetical protein